MKHIIIILLLLLFPNLFFGQDGVGKRATVMVVPWTSTEENILSKLDSNFNYRTAINEIRKEFDLEGFTTEDFVEKYRIKQTNVIIGNQNWKDIVKQIVDDSPADIFVEAEIKEANTKYGLQINLLLDAKDKYTGQSLANSGLLQSREVSISDPNGYAVLVQKALKKENALTEFLFLLTTKFEKIRKEGRSISVRVEVKEGTQNNLHTEVGDDYYYLSDLIIEWIKSQSKDWNKKQLIINGGYHVKSNNASLLDFDQINIPFNDEDGERFDINTFAVEMRRNLLKIGRQVGEIENFNVDQVLRGNSLILTISN